MAAAAAASVARRGLEVTREKLINFFETITVIDDSRTDAHPTQATWWLPKARHADETVVSHRFPRALQRRVVCEIVWSQEGGGCGVK